MPEITDKVNDKKDIEDEIEALERLQEAIEDTAKEKIDLIQSSINKFDKELNEF